MALAVLSETLTALLQPGERIVWSHEAGPKSPDQIAWLGIVFMSVWTAVVVYWTAAVAFWPQKLGGRAMVLGRPIQSALAPRLIMLAFGLVFCAIGAFGLWQMSAREFGRKSYALTEQRLIVRTSWGFHQDESFDARAFAQTEVDRGTLLFDYGRSSKSGSSYRARIEQVEDPADVDRIIRAALGVPASGLAEPPKPD